MRKSLFVFSLIVLTSLLGLAVAQQKPEPKPDESAQTAGKVLTGDVVTVDATKNEIVIKNDGGTEVHISVGASTKFFRGDKAIALADVKVGDKLTCECENSGEGCKAKGIVVSSPTPSQ